MDPNLCGCDLDSKSELKSKEAKEENEEKILSFLL
jgi:hypothetical protein